MHRCTITKVDDVIEVANEDVVIFENKQIYRTGAVVRRNRKGANLSGIGVEAENVYGNVVILFKATNITNRRRELHPSSIVFGKNRLADLFGQIIVRTSQVIIRWVKSCNNTMLEACVVLITDVDKPLL